MKVRQIEATRPNSDYFGTDEDIRSEFNDYVLKNLNCEGGKPVFAERGSKRSPP